MTNSADSSVTPIHVATNTAGTAIPIAAGVAGIAITPDGKAAYVTGNGGKVTPIDTATNTAGTPIAAGSEATGVAITPDQAPVAKLNEWTKLLRPVSRYAAANGKNSETRLPQQCGREMFQVFEGIKADLVSSCRFPQTIVQCDIEP